MEPWRASRQGNNTRLHSSRTGGEQPLLMLSPARAALRGQDLIVPLQTHLNVVNSKTAGASSVWGPEEGACLHTGSAQ